ncbi:HNH endonuclease signature motif containing protein [Massilia frigida]|nr:HNH endonuclease signature motif containing protein [Massilia frigida]
MKENQMVTRAKSVCRHAGCNALVDVSGHCEKHAAAYQKAVDARRGSASERGYNRRWQKARETFLNRSPLCVECDREGVAQAAQVVDHIVAHKGDAGLFWDTSNWQSLCKPHHDRKTAKTDGGFGRTPVV